MKTENKRKSSDTLTKKQAQSDSTQRLRRFTVDGGETKPDKRKSSIILLKKEVQSESTARLQRFIIEAGKDNPVIRRLQSRSLARQRSFVAPAPLEPIDQDALWQRYYSALISLLSGGFHGNLQVVTQTRDVYIDTPDELSSTTWELGDFLNQFGPTFRKDPLSTFSSRYGGFITSIKAPNADPSELALASSAIDAFRKAMHAYRLLEADCADEWIQYHARTQNDPDAIKTASEYYVKNGLDKYLQSHLDLAYVPLGENRKHFINAYGGFQDFCNGKDGILDRWLTYTPPLISSPQGQRAIYEWEFVQDVGRWLKDCKHGNASRSSIDFSEISHAYNYSAESIAAGAFIGFGFFGIIAGGQRNTVNIDTHDKSLRISFSGYVKSFDLRPSPKWFDSLAFAKYNMGPFQDNSPIKLKADAGKLFGPKPDCYFNFVQSSVFLCYKPELRIQFSQSAYSYFRQVTRGTGGFCLGPFVIGGGSYYNEKNNITWDDNTATLSLYNSPDYIQLLAGDLKPL